MLNPEASHTARQYDKLVERYLGWGWGWAFGAPYIKSHRGMPTASGGRISPTENIKTKGKATPGGSHRKEWGPDDRDCWTRSIPLALQAPAEGLYHLQVPSLRWSRFHEPT